MNFIEKELRDLTANEAAARLIGCELRRMLDGTLVGGKIVETEAYDESDQASHTYRGLTQRNAVMFGPAGRAYVYFTYGMHYCLNIVIGSEGIGSAVLIRALEPINGIETMALRRRNIRKSDQLCSGPAKLTQALAIDLTFNGHDLSTQPLKLILNDPLLPKDIGWTQRIGIREKAGKELYRRAVLKSSPYLSRPL